MLNSGFIQIGLMFFRKTHTKHPFYPVHMSSCSCYKVNRQACRSALMQATTPWCPRSCGLEWVVYISLRNLSHVWRGGIIGSLLDKLMLSCSKSSCHLVFNVLEMVSWCARRYNVTACSTFSARPQQAAL